VMANYYLASSQTRVINLTLGAAAVQAVLIWIFHGSIRQIVSVNILVLGLLLIGLLIPLFGNWRHKVK